MSDMNHDCMATAFGVSILWAFSGGYGVDGFDGQDIMMDMLGPWALSWISCMN